MEVMPVEPPDTKNTNNTITADQVEVDFLQTIYDIIRSVERDPHDNPGKVRESQDCSNKVLELQKKLDKARGQVSQLRGIDNNKEEQLQKVSTLRSQIRLKQELLQKYRNMYSFDSYSKI